MKEIQNSKNIITGTIDAKGNVSVGDIIINLKEAAQYKAIEAEIQELNERFNKAKQKSIQYPDDPDFTVELIAIDSKRSERQKDLEALKQEVIKLAEDFVRIPINTERLKKAKAHFENGEFAEARAVLNAEQMDVDLNNVIQKEELGKALQEQAQEGRKNLANEYLILARLTSTDFELSDRFEKAVEYFEQSLRAERNAENLFAYASFLQEHNQYNKTPLLYEEALQITRSLAQSNPQVFLPYVAKTLNNLAVLHRTQNELEQAQVEYEETLQIYQSLAQSSPQAFLPYVAKTLNNLAVLHRAQNELEQAQVEYEETLQTYRSLAQSNPQAFLQNVAGSLNNLAVLHTDKNELEQAQAEYEEALHVYRYLAQSNPQAFLPNVAMTLNNLGILHSTKNELEQAQPKYEEALQVYRSFAQRNPQTFLPDVAMILNNLGILHSTKNELEQAQAEYQEALQVYRSLAQINPQTFLPYVAGTLHNLAVLRRGKNELEQAQAEYEEALQIRKSLAQINPQAFLPYLASTLNNLAVLLSDKNELEQAKDKYEEALQIRKSLALNTPKAFLPSVAITAVNMANFFQENLPDRERSLDLVKECIQASLPFWEVLPNVQNLAKAAIEIVQRWDVDVNEFLMGMALEEKTILILKNTLESQ